MHCKDGRVHLDKSAGTTNALMTFNYLTSSLKLPFITAPWYSIYAIKHRYIGVNIDINHNATLTVSIIMSCYQSQQYIYSLTQVVLDIDTVSKIQL